jgi:hypothetical protein
VYRELAVERIEVVHGGVGGALGWYLGRGCQWRRRMVLTLGCRRWLSKVSHGESAWCGLRWSMEGL